MNDIKCKDCALYNAEQKGCVHWQRNVQEDDSCSYGTNELSVCDVCARPFIGAVMLLKEEDTWLTLCPQCAHGLSTCVTCLYGNQCAFAQDTSVKEPPMVERQIRQGNAIMITQVRNPERVKLTCEKCSCYTLGTTDEECGCEKEYGQTCPRYKFKGVTNVV